jgi:hypothetical protein
LAFETRRKTVIKILSTIFAASAIALTVGCAAHGNTVALDAGIGPVGYDGFYDDYYGPFYDGYWGADGFFYFSDDHGGFRRDDEHHFRREAADGFHGVHTHPGGFRAGGEGARTAGESFRASGESFRAGGEGFRAGGGGRR